MTENRKKCVVTGGEIAVEIADPRPGDPPILVADSRKAHAILSYQPRYSLEECIRHTFNWFAIHVSKR